MFTEATERCSEYNTLGPYLKTKPSNQTPNQHKVLRKEGARDESVGGDPDSVQTHGQHCPLSTTRLRTFATALLLHPSLGSSLYSNSPTQKPASWLLYQTHPPSWPSRLLSVLLFIRDIDHFLTSVSKYIFHYLHYYTDSVTGGPFLRLCIHCCILST